jgi:hypothetical protein
MVEIIPPLNRAQANRIVALLGQPGLQQVREGKALHPNHMSVLPSVSFLQSRTGDKEYVRRKAYIIKFDDVC